MDPKDLARINRISSQVKEVHGQMNGDEVYVYGFYCEQYRLYYLFVRALIEKYKNNYPDFYTVPTPGFAHAKIKLAFTALRSFLDSLIRQETLESGSLVDTIKEEFYIDEMKPFSAYTTIKSIIEKAVGNLKIIDNYIESNSLQFLFGVNNGVEIKYLTKKFQPNVNEFEIALEKFKKEWGGKGIIVKKTSFFHDRYIIVDENEVWHLGPSLNGIGIKPSIISKLRDREISQKVMMVFNQQWEIAK